MTDIPPDDLDALHDMFDNWHDMEPEDRLPMLEGVVNDEIDDRFDISDDVNMYLGEIDPDSIPEGEEAPDMWYAPEGDESGNPPGIYFNQNNFGFMEPEEALEKGLQGAVYSIQEQSGVDELDIDAAQDEAADWYEEITGEVAPSRSGEDDEDDDDDDDEDKDGGS